MDYELEKPIIKWVGGKTQIINYIIDNFPTKMDNYHEIFLGGGSVLLALLWKYNNKEIEIKKDIYAYDINETLINMYINIQNKPKKLLKHIEKLIESFNDIPQSESDDKINRKLQKTNAFKVA